MKRLWLFAGIAVLTFGQIHCATKKQVKTEVTRIDQEMETIETSVEDNQVRLKEHDSRIARHDSQLAELSRETQEALQRAQAAEKLAQGKLLYEVTLSDEQVQFASNRAELSDKAKDILENLLEELRKENKGIYIEIQGHTDSQGSETYNMELGLDRAEAVRRYLAENGIPLHRISTISYGESRPVTDNGTRKGRAQNRRVVIQVLE